MAFFLAIARCCIKALRLTFQEDESIFSFGCGMRRNRQVVRRPPLCFRLAGIPFAFHPLGLVYYTVIFIRRLLVLLSYLDCVAGTWSQLPKLFVVASDRLLPLESHLYDMCLPDATERRVHRIQTSLDDLRAEWAADAARINQELSARGLGRVG